MIALPAAPAPMSGQTIDNFRILGVLGQGGMGTVYKAEDVDLSRVVALKMIDPKLAHDATFVRRFRAEARALASIDSRHIVSIHALRQSEAGLYIVMEYVDGGTVSDLIQRGPVPWPRARGLARQMLTALEHAHGVGVVHRDIKPSNIMLSSAGVVKVTDFGLAKVRTTDEAATVTQGIAGTLFYMSPEQVTGRHDLDHRSDLFSLGLTIYQLLAGRLPFDRDAGEFAIMRTIVERSFPPPTQFQPGIPPHAAAAVMRALEKDPADRFQTAAEMRAAFEGVAAEDDAPTIVIDEYGPPEPPATGRRGLWVVAGLAVAAVLAIGAVLAWPYLMRPGTEPSAPTVPLTVQTDPAGAAVYVNGTRIGETPLDAAPVEAASGSLVLRFLKDGFAAMDTTVQATAGEPLVVQDVRLADLRDLQTAVEVSSSPSGAEVFVNGERAGQTPMPDLQVPVAGPVAIELRRDGCDPWSQRYEQPPETVAATLTCRTADSPDPPPATATLTLSVQPQGTATVEGERCQAGAACEVTAGTKRVRFTHPTYPAQTRTVTLRADERRALTFYYEQPVSVQVRRSDGSGPIWGTIVVDGEPRGQTTDLPLRLGPGRHTIEVRRNDPGYTVLTPIQTVEVTPGFEPAAQRVVFEIRTGTTP